MRVKESREWAADAGHAPNFPGALEGEGVWKEIVNYSQVLVESAEVAMIACETQVRTFVLEVATYWSSPAAVEQLAAMINQREHCAVCQQAQKDWWHC